MNNKLTGDVMRVFRGRIGDHKELLVRINQLQLQANEDKHSMDVAYGENAVNAALENGVGSRMKARAANKAKSESSVSLVAHVVSIIPEFGKRNWTIKDVAARLYEMEVKFDATYLSQILAMHIAGIKKVGTAKRCTLFKTVGRVSIKAKKVKK